ncbi:MAG: hypothetical protein NVS2B14_10660 [Chamaesiphon sp.]
MTNAIDKHKFTWEMQEFLRKPQMTAILMLTNLQARLDKDLKVFLGDMSSENKDQLRVEYEAGKAAIENGQYRQAVQHLEAASSLVVHNSPQGGEVQIWLVTAYEAAGYRTEAIALCKQLGHHPDLETRKQSKHLIYIMEAPQLNRRPEWLTQIPDLTALADGDEKFRQGSAAPNRNRSQRQPLVSEPIDLNKVNTKDNRFIWVALVAASLLLGSLILFH